VSTVNVTASTIDDIKKVPTTLLDEVIASSDIAVTAIPAPVSEMTILPLKGKTTDRRVLTAVIVK
jgi:hypothetical protein